MMSGNDVHPLIHGSSNMASKRPFKSFLIEDILRSPPSSSSYDDDDYDEDTNSSLDDEQDIQEKRDQNFFRFLHQPSDYDVLVGNHLKVTAKKSASDDHNHSYYDPSKKLTSTSPDAVNYLNGSNWQSFHSPPLNSTLKSSSSSSSSSISPSSSSPSESSAFSKTALSQQKCPILPSSAKNRLTPREDISSSAGKLSLTRIL